MSRNVPKKRAGGEDATAREQKIAIPAAFPRDRGESSQSGGKKIRRGAIKGGEGSALSGVARRTVDEITLLALAASAVAAISAGPGFAVYIKSCVCVRGTSENASARVGVTF